ncbi:hypothetical protein BBW65_02635 [Helicobacter enhydrae]|uniref:Folylpolyglutamate synthetase n=2 Tax=Helicobacter enhydrae TaxID=222136 RepID=A0A1B1U7M8_9HELI|nr:hypothetical protein BBW65_02635 [Helicobacter enhydrae]
MPKNLNEYLSAKGQETHHFDPHRIKKIFPLFAKDFLQTFTPKVIHIVGTNGKGSTGRLIARNLKNYLHFTSPHLFAFNERFYCDGSIVSFRRLEEVHLEISTRAYMQEVSYFEYATFLALFLARDLDYLVLEAGLGGEFDSTNVIEDKISVFTQIGLDHQEVLGESVVQIAQTKLKSMGSVAFLGSQNHLEVYEIAHKIAQEKESNLTTLQKPHLNFLEQNFSLACEVLRFLGVEPKVFVSDLCGRMQRIAPNVIVDVGHNVDGALALKRALGNEKVVLVFNAYWQKDIEAVLEVLRPIVEKVQIIRISNNERIIQEQVLCGILENLKISYDVFDNTLLSCKQYLVFGSFSVVAEFLKRRDAGVLDEK